MALTNIVFKEQRKYTKKSNSKSLFIKNEHTGLLLWGPFRAHIRREKGEEMEPKYFDCAAKWNSQDFLSSILISYTKHWLTTSLILYSTFALLVNYLWFCRALLILISCCFYLSDFLLHLIAPLALCPLSVEIYFVPRLFLTKISYV
jgi:hypothetical protein